MRRLMIGMVTMAVAAGVTPAFADAVDPAPSIAVDAATGETRVTGPHHLHKVAFDLNVTDWWLSGAIAGGTPHDPQLIVDAHMMDWAVLGQATDASGAKLAVLVLQRAPSPVFPKKVLERVAITLPRATAEKARRDGLAITVIGTTRSIPIAVPAQAVAAFLDGYDVAGNRVAAAATPAMSSPPVSPPPPAPKPTPAVMPAPEAAPGATSTATAPRAVVTPPAMPQIPPAPPPPLLSLPGAATLEVSTVDAPAPADASDPASNGGTTGGTTGTWVPSLGIQFVPTPSGAMVLALKPGSIADTRGIASGDFIESIDGVSVKTLPADAIAARLAAPATKVLHLIAAGDVKIR